ncbi:hypothetical protein [Roseimicrobium gellanilyticum]|nr:hypothetical protein [Roseimicrobium gellanilyticum]
MRLRNRWSVWLVCGASLLAVLCWLAFAPSSTAPKSGMVKVIGAVAKQGEYPWQQGLTAKQLVTDAGGLTPFGFWKVQVYDVNPAWHVKLGRRTKGLLVTVVNWVDDSLDSMWETCHLPGESPDLRMKKTPPSAKATVNLRVPAEDITLSPGDVVLVPERIVTF